MYRSEIPGTCSKWPSPARLRVPGIVVLAILCGNAGAESGDAGENAGDRPRARGLAWVSSSISPSDRVPEAGDYLDISAVPSGFPVGFCLLTHEQRQYVAYYDKRHRMTVAARALDEDTWQYQVLPSRVGWDSHNYITMAMDDEGYLHLSGNMHCVPLIYFRMTRPGDITSFERIEHMVGPNEQRCTYPKFMRGGNNELLFHYRDGGSGDGNEIFNAYDLSTKTWRRLLDIPLTDGGGVMNAYLNGPFRGPDGWFHLAWVWRDTPDCSTNHDPSYARSRDLVHWVSIDGTPIERPITIETPGVVIDPVPAGGGIINGSLHIGFDRTQRPLASYHKFDETGYTQVYVARFEDGQWVSRRVTDWEYRWAFEGGGAIGFEIRLGALKPHGEGTLAMSYSHVKYGQGLLVLDEETLALRETIEREPVKTAKVDGLNIPESTFENMRVKWAKDIGNDGDPTIRYALRWETLPPNRDRKPKGPLPEPSMLRLYALPTRK